MFCNTNLFQTEGQKEKLQIVVDQNFISFIIKWQYFVEYIIGIVYLDKANNLRYLSLFLICFLKQQSKTVTLGLKLNVF